jgi:cytoskeletal protein CcmA (bactofilin family)
VVEGEVISDKVVHITETATIKGPVTAETVIVAGNVKGSIEAKNKLEILATGKVNGSISAQALIIQDGATFNGKSVMPDSEAKTMPAKNDLDHFTDKEKNNSDKSKPGTEFELE